VEAWNYHITKDATTKHLETKKFKISKEIFFSKENINLSFQNRSA
jgi:hypothetical protein